MKPVTYIGYKHFSGDNWCAKCSRCGQALSRYANTEDQAYREGAAALKDHRCKRGVK